MKINLVCIEDRLMGIGFRKMASYIRSFNQSGNNYFITSTESLTVKSIVTGAYGAAQEYSDETLRNMAETLAKADIIGFSSSANWRRYGSVSLFALWGRRANESI